MVRLRRINGFDRRGSPLRSSVHDHANHGDSIMIYMHYCANCHYIHMLNGHKSICPTCGLSLKELDISYLAYSDLSRGERESLRTALADPDCLKKHVADRKRIITR